MVANRLLKAALLTSALALTAGTQPNLAGPAGRTSALADGVHASLFAADNVLADACPSGGCEGAKKKDRT